jgi:glycosyltransferase involved in cell wall biosynthesis
VASGAAVNYQNWHGFIDDRFGYGSMLSGFLSAVPEGVKISSRASVDVNMAVPFNTKGWLEGAHRVLFTMWETTQLPDRFVRWLDQYDQILVPCEHNVEVFSPYHPDVSYVPLGVDTQWWVPCLRQRSEKFRVRGGGSLWGRKGLDLVVEAFGEAGLKDAELEIKAAPHASDVPEVPEWVKLNRKWMSKAELREWFWDADLFLAPARGEGFGLIPLQAIAAGVPTIITATSGQAQFAHLATGVVSHKPKPSPLGGKWDEPNVDELVDMIRDAHSNYRRWRETALEKAVLADEFSWARASRKLADAVPEGRQLGPAKRVEPRVMFPVQVHRKCAVEVNGRRQEFQPGQVFEVDENTRDILVRGGYLVS